MAYAELYIALRDRLREVWQRRGIAWNDLAVAKKNVEEAGREYHRINSQYHELSRAISVILDEPSEILEEEISSAAISDGSGRDDQGGDLGVGESDAEKLAESDVQSRDS